MFVNKVMHLEIPACVLHLFHILVALRAESFVRHLCPSPVCSCKYLF